MMHTMELGDSGLSLGNREGRTVVYFIEAIGANRLKIGYTVGEPEKRLKELQTGCPHKLRLVHAIGGEQSDERELHAVFAHLRENGEWFRYEGEIRLFLLWVEKFVRPLAFLKSELHKAQKKVDEHEKVLFPDRGEEDVDDPDATSFDHAHGRIDALECEVGHLHHTLSEHRVFHGEVLQVIKLFADEFDVVKQKALGMGVNDSRRSMGGDCRM